MNFNLDIQSIINKYDRETIINTISSLFMITSHSVTLAAIFDSSQELKDVKTVLSGIQVTFTLRSTFNSGETVINNLKKRGLKGSAKLINTLETAVASIRIGTGVLGVTKFLNTFKLIDLEQLSSALGNIPVAEFLGNVSSGMGIVLSIINISIDSIKIQERSKKIDRVKEKTRLWTQGLTPTSIQSKINTQKGKYDALVIKTEALALEFINIKEERKTAKDSYREKKLAHKNAEGFKKIVSWIDLKQQKKTIKELNRQDKRKVTELNNNTLQENESLDKLNAWQSISNKWNNLTHDDTGTIAKLQADKRTKWKGKIKSLKIEQIKAAVGLGLKVVGLIMSIAGIILSVTGIGLIPAVAITMAILSLSLVVTTFGVTLFNRHTSPLKMEPVPVPLLPV